MRQFCNEILGVTWIYVDKCLPQATDRETIGKGHDMPGNAPRGIEGFAHDIDENGAPNGGVVLVHGYDIGGLDREAPILRE